MNVCTIALQALGSRRGIHGAGSAFGIADEAQCRAVVDLLAARPYAVLDLHFNDGYGEFYGQQVNSLAN